MFARYSETEREIIDAVSIISKLDKRKHLMWSLKHAFIIFQTVTKSW